MHRSSVFVVVLTSAFVAVAAGAPREQRSALARHRAAEVVRLRAHFDSVDAELRARDVAALSAAQRASRARLVAWLGDYRDAGRFPENDRLPAAAPFFRDSHGTLCAMAYLIERSGRRDIVDDVARSRNNAYIAELVDDPRLVAWLDSAGLTAREAARIQPTYGPPVDGPLQGNIEPDVSRSYAIAAGTLIGASAVTSVVNLFAPSRGRGVLGAVIGAGTVAVGVGGLAKGGEYRSLGGLTAATGALAAGIGIHALQTHPRGARAASRLTVSPALLDRRRGLGLAVQARF